MVLLRGFVLQGNYSATCFRAMSFTSERFSLRSIPKRAFTTKRHKMKPPTSQRLFRLQTTRSFALPQIQRSERFIFLDPQSYWPRWTFLGQRNLCPKLPAPTDARGVLCIFRYVVVDGLVDFGHRLAIFQSDCHRSSRELGRAHCDQLVSLHLQFAVLHRIRNVTPVWWLDGLNRNGEAARRHFHLQAKITPANRHGRIPRCHFHPQSRPRCAVVSKFRSYPCNQRHLHDANNRTLPHGTHAAPPDILATKLRRARSSKYPPSRNRIPNPIKLVARSNLLITSEK